MEKISKEEGMTSEARTESTNIYSQVRQYVYDIPYCSLEQIFEPITRTSDFIIVVSGYDVGDACARLGDRFREAGAPERFCEYDSLVYQLALLINKRCSGLHCRRRRL